MKEEIIMAGFGGQGLMLAGKLLAYAGMKEGKEVSWMPSYGPEMRGGTANCTVIVSTEQIPSPLSSKPDTILIMNHPSLKKFVPKVKTGGTVILNSSLIDEEAERNDLNVIKVPANEIAGDIGNTKVANMVMLGAYLAKTKVVSMDAIKQALRDVLPEKRHNLIPFNEEALDKGAALVANIAVKI